MPASWFARSLQTLRVLKTIAVSLIFCVLAPIAFAQTFTVLYSFTGGADGADPAEGLILDSAGNLYGSANYGGTGSCDTDGLHGCGVVFKVTKDGAETVLHTFEGGSDGSYPWGGLTLDKDGNLYGTTTNGGLGFGILFAVDKHGNEHILHRFTGGTDGAYPLGNLTHDHAGKLYGTSSSGGDLNCGYRDEGCGTLFRLSRSGGEVIHRFVGAPSDGYFPQYGSVLIDGAGNLYGTTADGGTANYYGTVYKLDPNGKYTILHSFTGISDGCGPSGTLAIDQSGNLYGATVGCGVYYGRGTIYEIDTAGSLTVLYTFTGLNGDGNSPEGGVTRDRAGNLYGTTLFGGTCSAVEGGCGTIFKLNPDRVMTILHSFDGYTDGMAPWGNVIQDAAGNLYGTTTSGPLNSSGTGTVWKIAP